jgi:hypothetical protein
MKNLLNVQKMETILESYTEQTCYIDSLVDQWEIAKSDLFTFFGNKLTIEKEFSDQLDNNDTLRKLFTLYDELENIRLFTNTEARESFYEIINTLTPDELRQNSCIIERNNIPTYKKGMKLSKFLRSLIPDVPDFITLNGKQKTSKEYFDIKYSMFNQSLTFNGILVISIDPLDYLTMSVNQNDWESCHANNGCYQAGMLSYMVDQYSAISYVKSKGEVDYNINYKQFSHNNKKWRSVVYISLNTFSSIHCRQYPADNESAAKTARKMIADQYAKIYNIPSDYSITRDIDNIQEMVKDCNNALHYNDIIHYPSKTASRLKMKISEKEPFMIIGEAPHCPVCGDHYLEESSKLVCEYCEEESYTCSDCGCRVNADNVYSVNDDLVCEYCYNENYSWCSHCEETEHNDNGQYIESEGVWVCDCCIRNNYTECEHCRELVNDDDITHVDGDAICSECLHDNYSYCDHCSEYVKNEDTEYYDGETLCLSCYDEIIEEESEEEQEGEA